MWRVCFVSPGSRVLCPPSPPPDRSGVVSVPLSPPRLQKRLSGLLVSSWCVCESGKVQRGPCAVVLSNGAGIQDSWLGSGAPSPGAIVGACRLSLVPCATAAPGARPPKRRSAHTRPSSCPSSLLCEACPQTGVRVSWVQILSPACHFIYLFCPLPERHLAGRRSPEWRLSLSTRVVTCPVGVDGRLAATPLALLLPPPGPQCPAASPRRAQE